MRCIYYKAQGTPQNIWTQEDLDSGMGKPQRSPSFLPGSLLSLSPAPHGL